MNKILGLALMAALALAGTTVSAQDMVREWSRMWGSISNDYGQAVAVSTSGYVYVAGYTCKSFDGQTNSGVRNAVLTCYDTAGEKQWTRIWGAADYTEGYAVAVDAAGALYVAGQTWAGFDGQQAVGNGDAFLTKFKSTGDREWSRVWGSVRIDSGSGIAVDASNYVYVCGYCRTNFDGQAYVGNRDIFYSKFAPDGTREYSRIWGSTSDDYGQGIAVDGAGHIYVAGYTYAAFDGEPFGGSIDAFLSLYKGDGTRQWSRLWGGTGVNYANGVAVDASGAVYVTGHGGPFGGQPQIGDTDPFLVRYDENGTRAWARIWGSIWADAGYAVATAGTNDIFVTGMAAWGATFDGQSNKYETLYLSAFHADGSRPWTRRWGSADAQGRGVAALSPSNLFVGGYAYGAFDDETFIGEYDIFLSRWAPNVPPLITWGPVAPKVMRHEAEIRWNTDKACDSQVWYGKDSGVYPGGMTNPAQETAHWMMLTNLDAATTYRYLVRSTDRHSNTVSSTEHFFETLAEPGGGFLVTNLMPLGEFAIPNAFGIEATGCIDRIDFFINGLFFGSAFGAAREALFNPESIGLNILDLVGSHVIMARAYSDTQEMAMVSTTWNFFRNCQTNPPEIEVEILDPYDGYTIAIRTNAAPCTNLPLRVQARENLGYSVKPLDRSGGFGPWGDRWRREPIWVGVKQVDFYINGVKVAEKTQPGTNAPFVFEHDYNLVGAPTGTYTFFASAITSNLCYESDSIAYTLEPAQGDLEVQRVVNQYGGYLGVTIMITNYGDATAYVDEISDDALYGFMPTWRETSGYEKTVVYDGDTERARAVLSYATPHAIVPGGHYSVTYSMVPVLRPGSVDYRVDGDQVVRWHDGFGSYSHTQYQFNVWAWRQATARWNRLGAAVSNILAQADYLVVTSPDNLLAAYDHAAVNELLASAAELALQRQGALAFTRSCAAAKTGYTTNDLFGMAHMFDDGLEEFFMADRDAGTNAVMDYLRSYNYIKQFSLRDHKLPLALGTNFLFRGDAMAAGFTSVGGTPYAQVMIAHGTTNLGSLKHGVVDIYAYDPLPSELIKTSFDPRHSDSYSVGDGFAVGDIKSGAGWLRDEIIVAKAGTGRVSAWGELNLFTLFQFDSEFRSNDFFLAGNVMGSAEAEVLVGDLSADEVLVYVGGSGALVNTLDLALDAGDALAVGDVGWDSYQELVFADESDDRLEIYRCEAGAWRLRAWCNWDFTRNCRLVVADMLPKFGHEILVIWGADELGRAAGEIELINWPVGRFPGDRWSLKDLIDADGEWTAQLSPRWASQGYLVLLGDAGIVSTFGAAWTFDAAAGKVKRAQLTDRDYANMAGSPNRPELACSRIVGEDAAAMRDHVQTLLEIEAGDLGTHNRRAYVVSGFRRGPSGDSDNINMPYHASNAARRLRSAAMGFNVVQQTTEGTNAITKADFFNTAIGRSVIHLAGHGNYNLWDIVRATDVDTGFTVDSNRPLVVAMSCSTANFQPGESMAEVFPRRRAAGYIGASGTAQAYLDNILMAFYDHLPAADDIGMALRDGKYDYGSDSTSYDAAHYNYNSAICLLNGDPKMTILPSGARRKAADLNLPQRKAGPLDTLTIQIPMYEVIPIDTNDAVTIPGQLNCLAEGQPPVPMYRAFIYYPPHCQVQDVSLTLRDGQSATSGLRIAAFAIADFADPAADRAPRAPQAGWWPTNDFDWAYDWAPGDTNVLVLTLYPFYYDAGTTAALFFTNYQFHVDYYESAVDINRILLDQRSYRSNATVTAAYWLYNTNSQGLDVVLESAIRSNNSMAAYTFPLQTLSRVQGLASGELEWDAVGYAPGNYYLEIIARDADGHVLDRAREDFELEALAGEVEDLELEPRGYRRGEDVTLQASLLNSGFDTCSGTFVFQVQDASGQVVAEFRHAFSALAVGNSMGFTSVWSNASLVPRNCQVLAFVELAEGDSTPPAQVNWTDAPLLLDEITPLGSNAVLRWPSVAGRTYFLEISTNLPEFTPSANFPATAPQNCHTDQPPGGVRFYRVREWP